MCGEPISSPLRAHNHHPRLLLRHSGSQARVEKEEKKKKKIIIRVITFFPLQLQHLNAFPHQLRNVTPNPHELPFYARNPLMSVKGINLDGLPVTLPHELQFIITLFL